MRKELAFDDVDTSDSISCNSFTIRRAQTFIHLERERRWKAWPLVMYDGRGWPAQ